eukprot:39419-Prorocentrum_minimum.AAC.3
MPCVVGHCRPSRRPPGVAHRAAAAAARHCSSVRCSGGGMSYQCLKASVDAATSASRSASFRPRASSREMLASGTASGRSARRNTSASDVRGSAA